MNLLTGASPLALAKSILFYERAEFTWFHLMCKEQLVELLQSQFTFLPLIHGSSVDGNAHIFMPILGDADQKDCSSGNENDLWCLCRIMKQIF